MNKKEQKRVNNIKLILTLGLIVFLIIFGVRMCSSGNSSTPKNETESKTKEPDNASLQAYFKTELKNILMRPVKTSIYPDEWTISKSGLTYTISSRVEYDDRYHDIVMKVTFTDSTYEYCKVSFLSIDGVAVE